MNQLRAFLVVALVNCFVAQAQTREYRSPRPGWRATTIELRTGESRIEIRRFNRLIRLRSFASSDGQHGKAVGHASWTTDGRYFVFNTSNTGGHQPWSWATYFYSRRQNRFYFLDGFVGAITSDFVLTGPNTVRTTRLNFAGNNDTEPVVVKLNRLKL